jgi:hypothetical protein
MSDSRSIYSNPKDSPTTNEARQTRRSPWGDRLIVIRESVLDYVTRTNPDEVLNRADNVPHIPGEADKELPAQLKRFIDIVKIDAMDEYGLNLDYETLRGSSAYAAYQKSCSPRLKHFDPQILTSKQEKLAFWINLYNALVIDGVISKHVEKSVGSNSLELLTFFRQTSYNVAGYRMSCDDIEHGILRGNRGHPMLPGRQFPFTDVRNEWVIKPVEVRIHFALNCAGRSCPPIQVYTAEDIDAQLDLATRNFVNTDLKIDPESEKVQLSAIFNWFKEDFGEGEGVIDFLLKYLPDGDRKSWLLEHRDSVGFEYKEYDWGLNSRDIKAGNNSTLNS